MSSQWSRAAVAAGSLHFRDLQAVEGSIGVDQMEIQLAFGVEGLGGLLMLSLLILLS